jgi:hypothetical protein
MAEGHGSGVSTFLGCWDKVSVSRERQNRSVCSFLL